MAISNELGARGEQAAVDYLASCGHEILCRNYRYGKSEIDIISKEGDTVVFTEVKLRSYSSFGAPEEFVDIHKQRRMKRAAGSFMHEQFPDAEMRFDIISVMHRNGSLSVRHLKDAFFQLDNEEDETYS